ncbi:efflux pump, RND family, membrane fusion protein [Geotalea daltonii FRC-32]|uniref:Efflux pump, RND family, membrane fusion protein n=1 Tax=Geotalea daltonii (strain DSM 22248 / JCM 15807 / FRC-32) TaxID=316067 RepID=B9LZF5_GEODF|nr:efflux RND transporter periplasmic adaptor subunit [Geotalea daltonii]ACM20708.1 efflux pump, RND family, membrane fusion protein [Geotalea daltonii FRC-32]
MADNDLNRLKIDKTVVAAGRPRHKRPLVWIIGVVAVILAILAAKGVLAPRVEVEVATVSQIYPSQAFTLLNASGYVVAQRKAAVASKTTAQLEWLGVEEGSRVQQGQIIARLENKDATAVRGQAAANLNNARAVLEQAKAELHDASLSFNRQKELVTHGVVARADFDAAEARFKRAKAGVAAAEANIAALSSALRGAEAQLDYTLIRAPFNAVVLTKDADVGDIVTPLGAAANAKAAVVTIADMDSLQVEADVSESNLGKIKVGQPCEITLDALPDVRFRGITHTIVPTADRSKATVMVKVKFVDQDRRILPEMSAKVAFLERPVKAEEQRPVTAVNPQAVLDREGAKSVFLVKDDKAIKTAVTTGPRVGDMLQVTSGVKAGDKIVLRPLDKLRDGSGIKTAEKQ